MSVVVDTRKLVQDFLAPELRTIAARLDALEKRFDTSDQKADKRFEAAEQTIAKRFDAMDRKIDDVDRRAEKRHDHWSGKIGALEQKSERRHEEVLALLRSAADTSDIKVRLARLEERQLLNAPAQSVAYTGL